MIYHPPLNQFFLVEIENFNVAPGLSGRKFVDRKPSAAAVTKWVNSYKAAEFQDKLNMIMERVTSWPRLLLACVKVLKAGDVRVLHGLQAFCFLNASSKNQSRRTFCTLSPKLGLPGV